MKPSTYNITLLSGDGIGPEVVAEAVKVLTRVSELFDFGILFESALIGGAAVDDLGSPYPDQTHESCKRADAVLLGAVGGPQYDGLPKELRPETGLLTMRKALDVFANLRPVAVDEVQAVRSPLRPEKVAGTNLLVVRELVGGIYFGTPSYRNDFEGVSTMRYTRPEIERIARIAFRYARDRRNKVTSVDKANVLAVSQLWREVVQDIRDAEFEDVQLEHMYVDNAAMQLILNPRQFDVILTGNLFGDILSDASAVLPGSLGMLPSASIGESSGLFEPIHGSAPDIVGKGIANPVATILSAAMMLDFLGENAAATAIRLAVSKTQLDGFLTADLATGPILPLTTSAFGDEVVKRLQFG
ncbi:MAG: 3-isopropylmalate dehydrogenase [Bacteroidetes Order II. Incertae sedis bacterium]|nr:3-isopropylmalate dehydrogenase [Bacteroidetes Order II. bacterium]